MQLFYELICILRIIMMSIMFICIYIIKQCRFVMNSGPQQVSGYYQYYKNVSRG